MEVENINIDIHKYIVETIIDGYRNTVCTGNDYDIIKIYYNNTVEKNKDKENACVYLFDLDKNTYIDFYSSNDEK